MQSWRDKLLGSAKPCTIHGCAQAGDLKSLKKLLRGNPLLINMRDPVNAETALHISSGHNRRDIVECLLYWQGSEKVELEATNLYGETPLHMAAMNGCTDIAWLLTNHGALVEAKANTGMTPLHLAAWYSLRTGDCSIVKTLLKLNADCSAEDNHGETPLHMAAMNGCSYIAWLLIKHGALVEAKANTGMTPLHLAVRYSSRTGDCWIVETLLELDADCSAEDNHGVTPLHMAAMNGCSDIAWLLINHGALVEAKANTGMTPLHLAVRYSLRTGDCSIVKTLLKLNADCSAEDNHGETPLHKAAMNGCSDIAWLLINHGALVEAKANTGMTPLHLAVRYSSRTGDCSIVETLLELEADCSAEDNHGETPLHMAAMNGCSDIAWLLINHGALVEAKANTGMTPLHLAVRYSSRTGDCSIVETLLELNADCNAEDNVNKTPLDLLPQGTENGRLGKLLFRRLEEQRKEKAIRACNKSKKIMDKLEKELSTIVGLDKLKSQLRNWAKGMVLDEKRRAVGLKVGARRTPHMAFLGNPGTGKTMVARILCNLLNMMGVLSTNKVTEVRRTDLVGEHIGQTGLNTRRKIKEAEGGILFVDEAYRLMRKVCTGDFGLEALEEIMSVMDSGRVVVIFAGYSEPMRHVIRANVGFHRRVTKTFHFDDFTSEELAKILFIKMSNQGKDNEFYGFKLHDKCTEDAVAELIQKETTKKQRQEMNGSLVTTVLANAKENLDRRLVCDRTNADELTTITLEDLKVGLQSLE